MVLKKAISAKIIASSRKVELPEIKQKTPINPTPEVIIRSSATTLSTTSGPFINLSKIRNIERQIIGITTYNK